jgi:hypothetical protein
MLLNNQVYTPVLLGVNGILENSYIYDGNGTTKDEANLIKKLYPKAKVGEFTEHKPGFMDTLRNLSPILALTVIASLLGGVYSIWKRYSSAKELKIREAKFDGMTKDVIDGHISKKKVEEKIVADDNVIDRLPKVEDVNAKDPLKSLAQKRELLKDGPLNFKISEDKTSLEFTYPNGSITKIRLTTNIIGEKVEYQLYIGDAMIEGVAQDKLRTALNIFLNQKEKVTTVEELQKLLVVRLSKTVSLDDPKLIVNSKNNTRLDDSGENGIQKNLLDKKYNTREQNTVVTELRRNFASDKISLNELEISLPRDYGVDWRENAALKSIVKKATGHEVVAVGSDSSGRKITYQLDGEITRFDKDDFNVNFKDKLIDIIKSEFDIVDASGRLRKRYPIVAATVSALGGTATYYFWKDSYAEMGSWIFGGCSKYVCNSTFLYGDKSSESSIGLKTDTLFQQVPFSDESKNYILNVAQVFAQTCDGMIKTSSESQTKTLYAGDSDLNVGKHYLVSDVNNKLCPIGDMDINKFIESVGVAQ